MSKLIIDRAYRLWPRLPNNRGWKVSLSLTDFLWWKFMPGIIISVPMPINIITLGHHKIADHSPYNCMLWLEKNIGKQTWDWDCGSLSTADGLNCELVIKIRRKYASKATLIGLLWQ